MPVHKTMVETNPAIDKNLRIQSSIRGEVYSPLGGLATPARGRAWHLYYWGGLRSALFSRYLFTLSSLDASLRESLGPVHCPLREAAVEQDRRSLLLHWASASAPRKREIQ